MTNESRLAILVPAYRERFLAATLESLAQQTDQRFCLYVFDDASQENLESVFTRVFSGGEGRTFIRFADNMGGRSLADHWNRCVRNTEDEPWVWLLSDDDVVDPECVAAFYRQRESNHPANVYRFNTMTINSDGKVTAINPPHPPEETAALFAYHRMLGNRKSFVSEYIFRRGSFDKQGGFVVFPYALGSDDASWITFSGNLPLRTIPEAFVYWRQSEQNVSRVEGRDSAKKYLALADYATWFHRYFAAEKLLPANRTGISKLSLTDLPEPWLRKHMSELSPSFTYSAAYRLARGLRERHFGSTTRWLFRLSCALFRARLGRFRHAWQKRLKKRVRQ